MNIKTLMGMSSYFLSTLPKSALQLTQPFVFNRRFLDIFGCARHTPSKLALRTRLHKTFI